METLAQPKVKVNRSALIAELCRRDFFYFVQTFWSIIIPEHPQYNWHIEYLCGVLEEEFHRVRRKEVRKKDIVINMPFRAAKSMITTVVFPVWCWIIDPKIKFICVSYSAELALELAQKSKDLMATRFFQD